MPVSNADINNLAECLQAPSLASSKKAAVAIENIVRHVRHSIPKISSHVNRRHRLVRQVIYGGSLAKGTAVITKIDVDLVFLLDMPMDMFLDEDVLQSLKVLLFECLELHEDIDVDKSKLTGWFPSAACKLYGINFDVLLGVCVAKGSLKWEERQLDLVQRYILSREGWDAGMKAARFLNGSISQSSVSLMQKETETLKLAVVLLKQWRDFHNLKQFKSFSVEMICLHAVEELRQYGVQRLTVRKIFERSLNILNLSAYSAKNPRVLSSEFFELYSASEWGGWIPWEGYPRRLVIVNPMTPNLDVVFTVQPENLREWSDAAEASLDMLKDPRCGLQDLFGVSPSDVQALRSGSQAAAVAAVARMTDRAGILQVKADPYRIASAAVQLPCRLTRKL